MTDETELTDENEELSRLRGKLEKIVRDNQEIESDLVKQGVAPRLEMIILMKLDLLANTLLGSGVERFEYEIEAQERIKDMLMHIQQDLLKRRSQEKLLLPNKGLQLPGG